MRARVFGSVAADYERFRRDYPDRLVTEIVDYAGHPVRDALEIGAGTGKATRVFARAGIAVTAVEPDAAMLDELRRHVPSSVTVLNSAFEQVDTDRSFDLVCAAAALHWTIPEGRWERVARLLRPGGVVASLGGPLEIADPELAQAFRTARSSVLDSDDVPPPDGAPRDGGPMRWPGSELLGSALFTDVREVRLDERMTVSAVAFIGYLSTVSAYLMLSGADRRLVLERIAEVLPDHFEVVADLDLHLARLC